MRRVICSLIGFTAALSWTAPSDAQAPVAEPTAVAAQNAALDLPKPPADKADWKPTGELAQLVEKLQKANKASREVFAPLSAAQMNWRPSDGTHTPRWNAEHLAATELGFFSQAYASLDPSRHKALRINPKQMPDDYVAAHPDWTGAEEAEQMKQIDDYVSGHAYLLEGHDLDKPLPGGRMPLGKMFELVAGHYGQHTANVKKKLEHADWPAE
jgi:hypothetical protein